MGQFGEVGLLEFRQRNKLECDNASGFEVESDVQSHLFLRDKHCDFEPVCFAKE
jgi:hypothetical protein